MPEQPRTLCAAFQSNVHRNPDRVAVRDVDATVVYTWREYDAAVRRVAGGLATVGIERGDTIATMLTNRPEFHVIDSAALHLGVTAFAVYNTSAPDQLRHVFANSGARVVFCESQFVERVRDAIDTTAVELVVCIDDAPHGTIGLAELEATANPTFDFDNAWRAVEPDDLATIIYTSGTTGPPKGVEHTHEGMLAAMEAIDLVSFGPSDSVFSYLPDAHAVNRAFCQYLSIARGIQVVTIADLKKVVDALPQLHPTVFVAVPAVWYKIKAAIEAALAAETGPKKAVAQWAVDVGIAVAKRRTAGLSVPQVLRVQHAVADRLLLSVLRGKLGLDKARLTLSGAAPLAPDAMVFLVGLGLPMTEGWGMSECGIGTMNPLGGVRIGTVGKAVHGMEIQLATDGELLIRGRTVMRGYRNEPDKTAETFDDNGWLRTGDVGTIDADGYLTIIDRKKELIINAAGKNMSPANIENKVKVSCPLVGSIAAIGDNRKFVTALVALDAEAATQWAAASGVTDTSAPALAVNADLRFEIDTAIKAANDTLSRVEQIRKFTIVPAFWEAGGEEITPTLKLKRKVIAKKYSAEIEALYE
jgi:long-chain acyl-CoA synthetase